MSGAAIPSLATDGERAGHRPDPASLTSLSASEIARCVASGDISAAEVVDAHIQRIEEIDGQLNAVVIRRFDEARAAAAAADDARRRGDRLGPLHGVPITIKEQLQVAGTQTTLGLSHRVGRIEPTDGPLVDSLRRAGAIVLGKTNVGQTLMYHESDNPVYGRTNNPWDPERTPGGSSGGEAAIVAARGSSLGLGGDLGGSLRVPAHFCGIHALKPTSRRLTNDDNPPGIFLGGQEAILPQQGPIARSVADLELALRVLTRPIPRTRDASAPLIWRDPADVDVSRLRIGMYTHDGFFAAAPAIRRAVDSAADALSDSGAAVMPFTPRDVEEAVELFLAVMSADGGAGIRHLLQKDRPVAQMKGFVQAADLLPAIRQLAAAVLERRGSRRLAFVLRSVRGVSAREYMALIARLNGYRERWLAAMDRDGLDALICPPYATPALRHGAGESLSVFSAGSYAVLFNVLGMPAGVVAATTVGADEETDRPGSSDPIDRAALETERGSAGLPVGVQVAARHWREDVVLAVMAALEHSFSQRPDHPSLP